MKLTTRKSTNTKTDRLQHVEPFRGLAPRELDAVARICDEVHYRPGDVLMAQGEAGWECFALVSGSAAVTLDGRVLGTVEPGTFVGEMSLLDRAPRSASVVARTPIHAFVFGAREFSTLLHDHPLVARHITRYLTRRLRESDRSASAAN